MMSFSWGKLRLGLRLYNKRGKGAHHVEGISDQSQTADVVTNTKLQNQKDRVKANHDLDTQRLRPCHLENKARSSGSQNTVARPDAKPKVAVKADVGVK